MPLDMTTLECAINLSESMSNMDGDAELLAEIIEIFVETAPQQLQELADHIAAGSVDDVCIKVHAMKGGASNFCAHSFVASALRLELLVKTGTLDGADRLLERMRNDFAELKEVVRVINWEQVSQQWDG